MKSLLTIPITLVGLISASAFAIQPDIEEVIKTGRYTVIKNAVSSDQANPLKVVIGTRLPQSVVTIEEAVRYLLSRSGYKLADIEQLSDEAIVLLGHAIPAIHRNITHVTLDKALMMLAGDAFELVVDPLHRRIAFELKADIANLYQEEIAMNEVKL